MFSAHRFLSYGAHQLGMLFTGSSAPEVLHGGKLLASTRLNFPESVPIGVSLLATFSMLGFFPLFKSSLN